MNEPLTAILASLREPFAAHEVRFKPKKLRQTNGRWECLALPYADKRVYEDRLNLIAYGEWSTPYTPPLVAGNKLVIPVTVIVCGVSHTDYGEAFLSATRNGEAKDEENSATEAYSRGFRRACAQFGLGRYLCDLPKLWLPYDPKERCIQFTNQSERIAWVEKLYIDAKILPARRISSAPAQKTPTTKNQQQVNSATTTSATYLVDEKLLAWFRRELTPPEIEKSCKYYRVADLAQLTSAQADHLSDYILQQKHGQAPSTAIEQSGILLSSH